MSRLPDNDYFERREQQSLQASAMATDICARRAHATLAIAYRDKRLIAGAATTVDKPVETSRPAEPLPHGLGTRPLRSFPLWVPA